MDLCKKDQFDQALHSFDIALRDASPNTKDAAIIYQNRGIARMQSGIIDTFVLLKYYMDVGDFSKIAEQIEWLNTLFPGDSV